MVKLQTPSKELAARIVTPVGFAQRLTGYRFRERTGPMSIALYSFEEVVGLLCDPFPRIDFMALGTWIRDVMGDADLAGRIAAIINDKDSDRNKTVKIRNQMAARLLQCKE